MKIAADVLQVLDLCTIEDNKVYLPNMALDRKLYVKVNECLESIGGKWNRKAKAHIFESNPEDLFNDLIVTGEFTNLAKDYQFFPTPKNIVEQMLELADIQSTDVILEPSAGQGAILDLLPLDNKKIAIELNEGNAKKLTDKGYSPIVGDFLKINVDIPVDKVVMNPPFSKQQDIDHVVHALSFLRPGGTLVSVMSTGPFFRENSKSVNFRNLLNDLDSEIINLPDDSFKESGTLVKTKLIKIVK